VRPPIALAFALLGFFALMIFGLGMTSLATGTDVISTPGFGQFPGIFGPIFAAVAFAGVLWAFLRTPRPASSPGNDRASQGASGRGGHPSFWGALIVAIAAFLAYLVGVGLVAMIVGADPAAAVGTVGSLATSWYGLVVFGAALIAAWAGIALVRTHADRPRWPWERRPQ
jgi:succinate dehydrogenase hydrophobic anchor subunit